MLEKEWRASKNLLLFILVLVAFLALHGWLFSPKVDSDGLSGSMLLPKGSAFASDSLHTRFFPYADFMSAHLTFPGASDPFFSSFVYKPIYTPSKTSQILQGK